MLAAQLLAMLTFLMLAALTVNFLKRYNVFKRLLYVQGGETKGENHPKVCHKMLHLDEKIKRVLFVGDVHGCHDELVELLELCEIDKEKRDALVVFTGDLVNKGPKSVQTVRLVRSMGEVALSVKGNHEQAVLRRLRSFKQSSLEPPKKYTWITGLSFEDHAFLEELPYTITIASLNVIVVHGGLVPGVKLQEQLPQNMISMRNYVQDELLGTADIDQGLPWASQWRGPEVVIFGHDARRGFQKYRNTIGLDTGCLYGGRLTGLLVNLGDEDPLKTGRFMSVNAHGLYEKT